MDISENIISLRLHELAALNDPKAMKSTFKGYKTVSNDVYIGNDIVEDGSCVCGNENMR